MVFENPAVSWAKSHAGAGQVKSAGCREDSPAPEVLWLSAARHRRTLGIVLSTTITSTTPSQNFAA